MKKYGIIILLIFTLVIVPIIIGALCVSLISDQKEKEENELSQLKGVAYAIYTDGNKTLTFTRSETEPKVGEEYHGFEITNVYTEFENSIEQPKWIEELNKEDNNKNSLVQEVIVSDIIRPISTKSWFDNFTACKKMDLRGLDTVNTTNMSQMFKNCRSLTSLNVGTFNTEKVKTMSYMFYGCRNIQNLDVLNFNTSSVKNMKGMFKNMTSIQTLDLSKFNTVNTQNMGSMFSGCGKLVNLNTSSFKLDNTTNTDYMFENCKSLKTLNLSNFYTPKVTDMKGMFTNCSSLTSIDISTFTIPTTEFGRANMFTGCFKVKEGYVNNEQYANVLNLSLQDDGLKWKFIVKQQ